MRSRVQGPRLLLIVAALVGLAILGAYALALVNSSNERDERAQADRTLESDVGVLEKRLRALEQANATISQQLAEQEKTSKAGIRPIANRVLASVFTVEGFDGSGSGWAAWSDAGSTYIVTAQHVVGDFNGVPVKVRRGARTWTGRVVKIDRVNDLALIRVRAEIGKPLWPDPTQQPSPAVGDELILIGSPYGLEGTVTTGVVSRITHNRIQTDAAANPGNSGGPAVDQDGYVVGVLLSGGGENLNFALPIQRLCVSLRSCA